MSNSHLKTVSSQQKSDELRLKDRRQDQQGRHGDVNVMDSFSSHSANLLLHKSLQTFSINFLNQSRIYSQERWGLFWECVHNEELTPWWLAFRFIHHQKGWSAHLFHLSGWPRMVNLLHEKILDDWPVKGNSMLKRSLDESKAVEKTLPKENCLEQGHLIFHQHAPLQIWPAQFNEACMDTTQKKIPRIQVIVVGNKNPEGQANGSVWV